LQSKLENPQKNPSVEYQISFLGAQSFYSDETTVIGVRRILPGHYVKNGKPTPYIDYLSYLGDEPANPAAFRDLAETIFFDLTKDRNTLLISRGTVSKALAGISKKLHLEKKFQYLHAYSPFQFLEEKQAVQQVAREIDISVRFQETALSGDIDLEDTRVFTGEIGDQLLGRPKNPALLNYGLPAKSISPDEVAKIWINFSDTFGRESGFTASKRIQALIESESVAREAYTLLVGNLANVFEYMKSKDYLHRVMLLNYLVKGRYRMWAHSQDSLDWVHPFADWQLFYYCFRRPSSEKVSCGGVQKWISLESWRPYLSELPWKRGMSGFGIPAKNKFRRNSKIQRLEVQALH
jgi:hypothetical protein